MDFYRVSFNQHNTPMPVEFNEGGGIQRRDFGTEKTPKMAAWIISKGWAKDLSGANRIQLVASLVFFAVAVFFFLR